VTGRHDAAVTAGAGRLRFDRPTPDDAEAVWRIHSDPRTNVHNPAGPMSDRDEADRRVEEWAAHWSEHGFGYWVVRDDSGVVGFTGLRESSWRGREVYNLYYRFAAESWGRGYATEAAGAAVALWRRRLSARPLVAYTTPGNVGSQRTALAAGLERRPDLDVVTGSRLGDDVVFVLGW
jgi:ribosomal-protein-alanine N-acetyltransferase